MAPYLGLNLVPVCILNLNTIHAVLNTLWETEKLGLAIFKIDFGMIKRLDIKHKRIVNNMIKSVKLKEYLVYNLKPNSETNLIPKLRNSVWI